MRHYAIVPPRSATADAACWLASRTRKSGARFASCIPIRSRPWTLAALAREVGMSRSAFASRFAQIVGVPPIEYLANWRMTLAKSALASSEVPMTDIAEMAGYQSVSAFSTAFKRETGLSPTLYVRSLQEVT